MAEQVVLQLLRDGAVVHTVPITKEPLHIGRGPANGLVLSDSTVSTHHAMVWAEGGQLWVRDLDSRNGTFLDGNRITKAEEIREGQKLRLGSNLELRLQGAPDESSLFGRAWLVEDITDGLRFPVAGDRLHFGSGTDAHIVVPGDEREATLVLHSNGEVWLGTDDEERELEDGAEFEVSNRTFRLLLATSTLEVPTMESATTSQYPYRLLATLNGAVGPEATLEWIDKHRKFKVDAENRAVLLYLLARKVVEDRSEGRRADDQGWCTDDEISTGIWGRNAPAANSLHVLVYRLRKQIKGAGFDPWFIEKKRRAIRIRLDDVEIDS